MIRYFSMFSGIGGFELGLQYAIRGAERGSESPAENQPEERERFQPETGKGATSPDRRSDSSSPDEAIDGLVCIGYSEIDEPAIRTYEKHFKEHRNYGDATKLNPETLPDFDLLVGGFPCQPFSHAGQRRGFNDIRGTLFFDIARVLEHKRPRHLVLENVRGLLSHKGGETFQTILRVLSDLGYIVEWQVLNSADFGVPQTRERIYIIGHLRGESRPKVFPITGADSEAPSLEREKGLRLVKSSDRDRERIYDPEGMGPTLDASGGGGRQPFIKVKTATAKGYDEAYPGDSINLTAINSRTRRARVGRQKVSTLDTGGTQGVYDGLIVRRLTPLEYERAQAFPDNWTEGHSDTQRYKQAGNAVTVNVVKAVMERLLA